MAEPDRELMDALFREKVRAARRMTLEEKVSAGGDLFDEVCERMRDGIRAQFPDADEAAVERELVRRLDIAERLEQSP